MNSGFGSLAGAIGAMVALTGCVTEGLSDRELRELTRNFDRIEETCREAGPGPETDRRLRAPLEHMIELARQDPDRDFDPDPGNHPEYSDSATPAYYLVEAERVFTGRYDYPECSVPLALRAREGLEESGTEEFP